MENISHSLILCLGKFLGLCRLQTTTDQFPWTPYHSIKTFYPVSILYIVRVSSDWSVAHSYNMEIRNLVDIIRYSNKENKRKPRTTCLSIVLCNKYITFLHVLPLDHDISENCINVKDKQKFFYMKRINTKICWTNVIAQEKIE